MVRRLELVCVVFSLAVDEAIMYLDFSYEIYCHFKTSPVARAGKGYVYAPGTSLGGILSIFYLFKGKCR